jgi:hypothetical protein
MRNLKTLKSNLPKPQAREMTRMDKLKAHYLEGRKLPKSLEETLQNLEKANGLLCSGYSKEQAVKFIMERDGMSKSNAYKILRDSMELFGDVTKASKDGLRHIATENLMQIYNQARSVKNLEMAERVWDTICKLNGLYGRDEGTTNNNLQMNMQFVFSTDPSVLTQESPIELPEFSIE